MPTWISENKLNPINLPERLRALPDFDPPAGGWSRLSQRMQARRRRFVAASGGLALAASVLAAIGLVNFRPASTGPSLNGRTPAPPSAPASRSGAQTLEVAQLIDRSQRLERQLSQARPQVVVWNSGRASRAALLERKLARVDAELNYAQASNDTAAAERLWSDRVELMNALVELHQPEAPALQYASYQY